MSGEMTTVKGCSICSLHVKTWVRPPRLAWLMGMRKIPIKLKSAIRDLSIDVMRERLRRLGLKGTRILLLTVGLILILVVSQCMGGGVDLPIAVNLAPDESRTAPVAIEELEQWGAKLGTKPVSEELAARLPVSRPAVSQHLKVLKDAGLEPAFRSVDGTAAEAFASIRGRLAELGGTATLETGSFGTEWELVVPRD